MGWLTDLISETSGPRGSGTPGTWGSAIGRTLENFNRMDPEYARRREAEQLLTGRMEHQRLTNALLSGQVDEQGRLRAERAAAPDATARLLDAYGERPSTPEWGEEEGAGVQRTVGGRTVAKSVAELLKRGAGPADVDLVSRQRPDLMKALGFQAPADLEAAEMETTNVPNVGMVRKRTGEVVAAAPPPAPKLKIDRIQGKDGFYNVVIDETTGKEIGRQKLEGIEPPGSKGVYTREDIDDQIRLEDAKRTIDGKPPMNALEKRQRYNDLARSAVLAEGGNLIGVGSGTPIATGPPKTQALPAGEATDLADFRTLLGQLDKVDQLYQGGAKMFVGPAEGRIGAVRTFTGINATKAEADFRSELASIQNSIIYLKSGKQINEQEYERLRRELPEISDPEPVFEAKLARARVLLRSMLANRESEFSQRGFRGGDAPAAPGAAPKVRTQEPTSAPTVIRWGRDANGRPVRLP